MPDGKVVYRISGDNSQLRKDAEESESILSKAGKVGVAAIGAASAAVGGFAAASVGVGANFDKSMSQVAATMGKTVDEIGELRDFAQEMGASTAFSANQAADALNYMALAGYDAQTSMEMLPNVLNLAAAGDMELARASDMVTDASSALGLSLDEISQLVDKMAQTASKSNTSVSQLGDAILTVGGTAKNLAGGITELSTALGILADNGVKGSEGGTALRNIILAMTPTTNDAVAAFEKLGLESYDAEGNLRPLEDTFRDLSESLSTMSQEDRTRVLNDIFNKVDLKSVNALLGASGDAIGAMTTALFNSDIAWDKYAEAAEAAGQTTEDWVTTWAQEAKHYMEDLGMTAEEAAQAMSEDYVISLEDSNAMLEIISDTLSNQSDRWDELSGYIDDATGAAGKMADTQLDNLSGDITLFQSALEGAQIVISDALTPTLREFVQFGSDAVSTLSTAFQEGGLTGAMDALGAILSEGLALIISELPTFIGAGLSLLESIGQGILDNLPLIIETAMEIILSLAEGIAQDLPELIPTIVDVMLAIVDTLINNVDKLIDAAIQIIVALAVGLIQALPRLLAKAPELIASLVEALIKNAPKLAKAGIEIITTLIKTIGGMVGEFFKMGGQLLDGLKDGILSKAMALKDSVVGAVSGAWGAAKKFLGISSPSKLFAEMGGFIDEGLAKGIERGDDMPINAMQNMVANIAAVPNFDSLNVAPSVTNVVNNNTTQTVGGGRQSAIMVVNGRVFGEIVYSSNGGESQRVGVVYG